MRFMHLLSTFSAVMLPLVCVNVFPYCLSRRVEEKFEKCVAPAGGMNFSTNKPETEWIANGTKEYIKNFPFTVQLLYAATNGQYNSLCGGSVISTRFVLTAAHCFDKPQAHYAILAGSSKLYDGKIYEIEEVTIHPSYKRPVTPTMNVTDADVAVLLTSTEIQFTDYVKAVKLPAPGEEIAPGTMADVLGWGRTSEPSDLSPDLVRVQLPVLSHENCMAAYSSYITKNMFCAGYKEGMKSACGGDSGGPLVINGTLFGVVSAGHCSVPNCPTIFVNISEVLNWITTITG